MGDVGLVVDAPPANMHGGGVLDDALLFGVAVEPDHRAQAAADGGAGLAAIFEVTGEALDVDAADVEQPLVVLPAPGGERAQIERVRVTGESSVAEQDGLLDLREDRLVPLHSGRGECDMAGTSRVMAGRPTTVQTSNPRPMEAYDATPAHGPMESVEVPFGALVPEIDVVIRR